VAQATTSSPVFGQPPAGGPDGGGAGDGDGVVVTVGVTKLWVSDHGLDVLESKARTRQKCLVPDLSSWLMVNLVSADCSATVTIATIAEKDSFSEISKV